MPAKKRTSPPDFQEPVEVDHLEPLESAVTERETFERVTPRYADEKAPDTSQNAPPPRGIAVPGNNPAMKFDRDQEARLRATPAVPGRPEPPPLAHSAAVRSAISEEPLRTQQYSEDRVTNQVALSEYDEPIETDSEKLVIVKPRTTFDCFIGGNRWYFEKDKPVRVPQSVREVLARGEAIYP